MISPCEAFENYPPGLPGKNVRLTAFLPGGVGINLAIQDAVAAANILAAKLAVGSASDADLDAVRQRRLFPVKVIQALQVAIHKRVLQPRVSGADVEMAPPWPLRLLDKSSWLRQWPARLLGVGIRPEHVHSPVA